MKFGTSFAPGSRRIKTSGSDILKLPKDGGTIRFRQIAGTPWIEYARIFLKAEVNGEATNIMVPFPTPPEAAGRVLLPDGKTLMDRWPHRQARYRAAVWSYDDGAVMVLDAPGSVFSRMEKTLEKYGALDGYDLTITGDTTGTFVKYTVNTPPKGDLPLSDDVLARIANELPAVLERLHISTTLEEIVERIPGASLLEATEAEMDAQNLAQTEPPPEEDD